MANWMFGRLISFLRLRVSCVFWGEVLVMSLWIQELCYLLFRSLFWTQYNDLTPFFACKWWLILENPTPFILRISLVLPPIPWSVCQGQPLVVQTTTRATGPPMELEIFVPLIMGTVNRPMEILSEKSCWILISIQEAGLGISFESVFFLFLCQNLTTFG